MENIDFNSDPSKENVARITEWLARGGYKIIQPLETRTSFSDARPPDRLITVAILDTETTGVNHEADKLIELGMVFVEVCPETGQAFRVLQVFNELEDPGMPIPEESTRVHNITDEMVKGKRIDDAEVEALMASVSLVVAHNAGFDRIFVEKRFAIFASKHWACSLTQVPWAEEGIGTRSLEFLAYRAGFHFTGHRASTDCHALLEVLQHPLPNSGAKAMQALLGNARTPDIKVTALGSPFETKDILRERGYRWSAEKRAWAKSIQPLHLDAETDWLKTFVYSGKGFRLEQERLTSLNRFSNRPGQIEVVKFE